jgi:hypothetical protein
VLYIAVLFESKLVTGLLEDPENAGFAVLLPLLATTLLGLIGLVGESAAVIALAEQRVTAFERKCALIGTAWLGLYTVIAPVITAADSIAKRGQSSSSHCP